MSDSTNVILKRLETLQKSVDRLDRDMAEDRKNIDQLLIRQGSIDERVERLMNELPAQTQKIKDTVKDGMEEVANNVEDIKEVITS